MHSALTALAQSTDIFSKFERNKTLNHARRRTMEVGWTAGAWPSAGWG